MIHLGLKLAKIEQQQKLMTGDCVGNNKAKLCGFLIKQEIRGCSDISRSLRGEVACSIPNDHR